jgi:integrase
MAAINTLRELANNVKSGKVVDIYGAKAGLVFPAKGNIDNPRDMHMTFNKVVKRVQLDDLPGVGKLRIHDLRHLCGTFLVMDGVDIETVRDILGHTNLTTTQRNCTSLMNTKKCPSQKSGTLV